MVSDFTKTSASILLAIINDENAILLTPSDVSFGVPSVVSGDTHNTRVAVTAVPMSGYVGSVNIRYNRVDLADIPGDRSKSFTLTNEEYVSDIIAAINARYEINLTPADFVEAALPPPGSDFVLTTKPTSLIYKGTVVLHIASVLPDMTGEELDVFLHADALHTLLNVTMPGANYLTI